MLDSYFFVPGDKQKYLDKVATLEADFIVIDLEDAVALQNKQAALALVLSLTPEKKHFVRIPFLEDCYSKEQVSQLIIQYEGRIVLPKVSCLEEVQSVVALVPTISLQLIVLVENPTCFIHLPAILNTYSSQIHAVGFGSHDFCSITGIKHTLAHLAFYKRQLILITKAYKTSYLDGVDLNLTDFAAFNEEALFAFEIGASGKFLIHPKQIAALKNIPFMSESEMEQLTAVYEKVKDIPEENIEVHTIDGKVYEKPHIIRIKHLMHKIQQRY
ncbi:HpcH/HpaI aldolase/citrate lyase family protein [Flavobacterium sp. SM2513]|uniref:HpcH/HpaI aldolase/citrate lyase family protein n=1 Tax=Flavobacterium sp. SM2513 TaxID=3424766 RepID=UPI003D7F3B10